MPNVTSETHNSSSSIAVAAAMHFGYLFLLLLHRLLLLLLLLAPGWKHHGKNHLPAGKHHASEGRRSPKIAPRKCLT